MTLEELIILISGQDFPPEKYNSIQKGLPYIIGASNILNGNVIVTRWTESPTVLSEKNDLLIVCKGAGVGKMGINQIGKSHIARQIQAIRPFSDYVYLEYIRIVLMKGVETICSQANGLIPGLPRDLLLNFPIPLPPLSEQKNIVNGVASMLHIIELLEADAKTLKEAVPLAKSKILDLAMQGKLVSQDPADEPAATMLRRINPKAKIITDNQHYWNIPKSWCWCQLGDIFNHNTGKALNSSNKDGIVYEYITTSNVYWGKFELHSLKKMLFKDNEIDKCLVKKGDLLICEGGDVGRAAVWDLDTTIMIQNHLHRLRPYSERISAKLYCIFMKAFKDKQLIGGKGIALQGFSSNALHKLIMPLPPASEQKRILAKIEELFWVLDSIEASLQS